MESLELKKLKVELLRVSAAKGEMELRICMAMDEIERVKKHIDVSDAKEIELKAKIKEMESK